MQVHHIGYLVKRISEAEETLSLLGFTCERKAEYDPIRDATLSFWVNGNERIELVEPCENSSLKPLLKRYKNSPYHICFLADDLEKAKAEYESKGFVLFKDIELAPCLDGRRVVFLMSPGAGIIEIADKEPL
ncbi:MAG: VOC family protein [Saccharofermentans sp.]|nr:VOC family protein [Saccharofermentans sp.]